MSGRLRLVRDFAALALGEGLSKVAGFAAFAWLARVLSPEGYGAVELAVALSLFFLLVVDFGFGPIGAREIARAPERARELAGRVPAGRLLLSALAVPLMVGTLVALGQPRESVELGALFALGLFGAPFIQRWLLQGLDRMAWVSGAQALRMAVFLAGVLLLVRTPEHLLRVGAVEVAAAAAMALYFAAVQRLHVGIPLRLDFDLAPLRRLAREAAPVGAGQGVWALNQYLPTVLVAMLLGGEAIAWFGGAHRIVLSLGTFVWLYHFNLFPSLARSTGVSREAVGALVGPSFRVTAWLGVTAALVLSLWAAPLVRLAFGAGFEAAAAPLALLAWVLPVSLLSGHARYALIAAGHQRLELGAQLLGAVATAAVGLVAIPLLGPRGGALAMVLSAAVVWVAAHRATVRHVAPLPFLGPLWRPALVAAAAGAGAGAALASPWAAGAAAGGACLLLAPLVDPGLARDLRLLAGAKSGPLPAGATRGVDS